MSESIQRPSVAPGGLPGPPWGHVLRVAAALAAAMGVGRFVYTPILPLMHAQARLTAGAGAHLATANYVGYLVGALAGTFLPRLTRSAAVLRGSLLLLVASLAAMPLTRTTAVWLVLRLVAGAVSATVFVIAVSALLGRLREHPAHLPGWGFGGVGAGIALSGLLVLVLRGLADWRAAWWASAALAALLSVPAWTMRTESAPAPAAAPDPGVRVRTAPRTHRWFGALFASYTLEGVGYIIAGTFLVAAIDQGSPGRLGTGAWVLAGVAAVPSAALWAGLGRRWSRPDVLLAALVVQAAGIALPALVEGPAAALVSALLFGATFIGVSTLALAAGTHLRFPRAVALLTAGYSVGQILGPLAVEPLLRHGYRQALVLAALVVLAAAAVAFVLRVGFPHRMDPPGAGEAVPGGVASAGARGL
ncbi:YbfB/YjiJ family MFS transporter [Actinacidiphila glaucinigra]|uniref:Predicted arabinose efflux permease, MFS family n=1 Tax=Actinacidiphila glaucinigra TaxID=235986 RepID=A0A239FS97_9ACTN|nr:YbfB/YjiJ family MFS transporter [Actinacidiphila glaucinigra]SNS59053.1 Predicted arabinose efflux permease, MFS family [Actinacidiphila glaucinigra]